MIRRTINKLLGIPQVQVAAPAPVCSPQVEAAAENSEQRLRDVLKQMEDQAPSQRRKMERLESRVETSTFINGNGKKGK